MYSFRAYIYQHLPKDYQAVPSLYHLIQAPPMEDCVVQHRQTSRFEPGKINTFLKYN